MTVKDNILPAIENKTASPKAKPLLLPSAFAPSAFLKCFIRGNLLLNKTGRIPCSTAHLSTAQLSQATGLPLAANRMFFYTAFSKGQKQVGQVGQWSIVSTIYCLLSRYKASIAGWS